MFLSSRCDAGRRQRQLRDLLAPRHGHVPPAVRRAERRSHRRHQAREPREVRLARGGRGHPRRTAIRLQSREATTGRIWGCDSTRPSSSSIRTRRLSPGNSATPTTCCSPTIARPGGGELVLDHARQHRGRRQGDRDRRHAFDWQGDVSPDLTLEQLVHLRSPRQGLHRAPILPREVARHLPRLHREDPAPQRLGINAVELLPVHEFYVDDFLLARGLDQLLGLQHGRLLCARVLVRAPAGRPAARSPSSRRSSARCIAPASRCILDVVYNHTGEGNELGPSLMFRGLDNTSYYSLTGPPDAPRRYYMNFTGCGNSLNFDSPAVIRLVMDSLRYWVEVMHVDGFRFDLASVLGRREDGSFRSTAPFFDAVSQDPVLNRAILIAEPWDIGTYQVGNFPGRLVGVERQFPRHGADVRQGRRRPAGRPGLAAHRLGRPVRRRRAIGVQQRELRHLSRRLHAARSGVLQPETQRGERREQQRRQSNDNNSWNCGVEGPTDDPARARAAPAA